MHSSGYLLQLVPIGFRPLPCVVRQQLNKKKQKQIQNKTNKKTYSRLILINLVYYTLEGTLGI